MSKDQVREAIKKSKKDMEAAAKELDFIEAAKHRDEMNALQKILNSKSG